MDPAPVSQPPLLFLFECDLWIRLALQPSEWKCLFAWIAPPSLRRVVPPVILFQQKDLWGENHHAILPSSPSFEYRSSQTFHSRFLQRRKKTVSVSNQTEITLVYQFQSPKYIPFALIYLCIRVLIVKFKNSKVLAPTAYSSTTLTRNEWLNMPYILMLRNGAKATVLYVFSLGQINFWKRLFFRGEELLSLFYLVN